MRTRLGRGRVAARSGMTAPPLLFVYDDISIEQRGAGDIGEIWLHGCRRRAPPGHVFAAIVTVLNERLRGEHNAEAQCMTTHVLSMTYFNHKICLTCYVEEGARKAGVVVDPMVSAPVGVPHSAPHSHQAKK